MVLTSGTPDAAAREQSLACQPESSQLLARRGREGSRTFAGRGDRQQQNILYIFSLTSRPRAGAESPYGHDSDTDLGLRTSLVTAARITTHRRFTGCPHESPLYRGLQSGDSSESNWGLRARLVTPLDYQPGKRLGRGGARKRLVSQVGHKHGVLQSGESDRLA